MADPIRTAGQGMDEMAGAGQVVASSPTVTKSLPGVIPAPQVPAPKLPAQNVVNGGSVDARTKALLEAVATGGKRGLQAYQDSEQAIGQYRQQALGRANKLAGIIGGPEAQGFEQVADQQYGARLADLSQARTAFTEDMARRGLAGRTAVDAFGSIAPLVRAQVEHDINQKRADKVAEAKDKISKDWETRSLGQAEMDENTARDNVTTLDKDISRLEGDRQKLADAATNRTGRISDIDKRLGDLDKEWRRADSKTNADELAGGLAPGKGGVRPKKQIEAEADALRMERHKLIQNNQKGLKDWDTANGGRLAQLKADREKYAAITPETRAERARGIATNQLGIEAPLATGKINSKDTSYATAPAPDDKTLITKAGLKDTKELTDLRGSEGYKKVHDNLTSWVQNGVTKEQFLAALRSEPTMMNNGAFNAKLYNLLVTEVGNLFPTSASLRSMAQGTE